MHAIVHLDLSIGQEKPGRAAVTTAQLFDGLQTVLTEYLASQGYVLHEYGPNGEGPAHTGGLELRWP